MTISFVHLCRVYIAMAVRYNRDIFGKIRKRCQGSGSRAKYLAARKFHFKFLVLSDCVA